MEPFQRVEGVFSGIGASSQRAIPGSYRLVMRHGDQEITKTIEVKADPRWKATEANYQEQDAQLNALREAILDTRKMAEDLRSIRAQIQDLKNRIDKSVYSSWNSQADSVIQAIDAAEGQLIQTKQKTFQDVINFPNKLDADLLHLYGAMNDGEPPVTAGQKQRAKDLLSVYGQVKNQVAGVMTQTKALEQALVDQKIPILAPKQK
jgi:hypothetical protein